jgi:drug/metabolite transporter (DMT)-like permease
VQLTSVANATLLANLASIFVTLAAWVFLRQRPTPTISRRTRRGARRRRAARARELRFSSTGLIGDALGVVTAMFYAGYLLTVKSLRDRGETTLCVMAVTTTITAIMLFPSRSPLESR